MDDADRIIAALGLQPHPEGGWYAETWRAGFGPDGRSRGTAIHYLLRAGEESRWHRVDADEIWLHHAGDPLVLRLAPDLADAERAPTAYRMGPRVDGGEVVQAVVPAGSWQAARPLGAWSLVSCVVVPGFEFRGFDLAPDTREG